MLKSSKKYQVTRKWKKGLAFLATAGVCFGTGVALGATSVSGGIGSVATTITSQFGPVAKAITAGAYVSGFGFSLAAIMKFKAHKDNPQQIPIGTPIALLFIAVALIFIPSLMKMGGRTIFGSGMKAGGISGISGLT